MGLGPAGAPPSPALAGARRRWPARVALLVAIAAIVALNPGTVATVAILFVVVVPFEKLFPRHEQKLRRPGAATDIAYALLEPVLTAAGLAVAVVVGIVSLAWLPGLVLRPLVALLPAAVVPLAGLVLFDLSIYWAHRWSHEVPFLWRFHSVHHSPERMDWISGFRSHPVDGALLAPPFVLLLAAGFSPELSGALAVIQIVTGLFLHANVRWRWRPLHRIVITPEFHHWHHSSEPDAINTDYAVFLPLWDQLFRTYHMPRDRRPERYGITDPMPEGVVAQLRQPLRGLPGPRWVVRHPVLALRRLRVAVGRGLDQLWCSTTRSPKLVGF